MTDVGLEQQFGVPRCKGCGYVIENLPGTVCPECGTPFDFDDPDTYTIKPPFVRWRYWLPALLLALGAGVSLYLVLVGFYGFGPATVFAVPLSAGAVLGYAARVRKLILGVLIFALALGLFLSCLAFDLTGMLCGLMLTGLAFGPLVVGAAMGAALRRMLKNSQFNQRWHLPLIFFLLAPLAWGAIEGATRAPYSPETVRTSAVIDAPPYRAWDALVFYEEVRHGPPPLFRMGMPRPLYVTGSAAVGDSRTCVYDKGRLSKRVTRREPGRLLEFVVTEQGFERHAMTLESGGFSFEPLDGGRRTRVTLTTTFHPHLGPRRCWRPLEQLVVRTLHDHVLRGMREAAESR